MVQSPSPTENRVGPFVAGSTSSDLIGLANQGDPGLRVLQHEEQQRDYDKARCDALASTAREFCFDFDRTSSLIFQKTRDTTVLPDFVEYVYCWLADDRLCGFILSGVTSNAGTHEQINQQESAFWEHTAEVAEALSRKYPESPESFVNFFNFGTYSELPQLPASLPANLFTGYQRLVTTTEDNEPTTRIETHYCGPALVHPSRKNHDSDIPTAATHSRQSARRFFANQDFLVVYDVKIERYVRTIGPSMSSKTWSISPASWPTTLAGN